MSTELTDLLDQVRLVFHRAAQAADELHRDDAITAGSRALLEWLRRHDAATVAQIARDRFVTRQHIQALVDQLAGRGLLTTRPNPAHRRSPLVELTDEGRRTIDRIFAREQRYIAGLALSVDLRQIKAATRTLSAVLSAMEGR
jgi:DNA-binding MarR family transcriptional regulator